MQGKVFVEVVQHLAAVPGRAYSRGVTVQAGVHAKGGPGGEVTGGHAQAERGAQVEQASPGHPLPALVVFVAGARQDEGIVLHPEASLAALVEESKIIGVLWRCAEREGETLASVDNADENRIPR